MKKIGLGILCLLVLSSVGTYLHALNLTNNARAQTIMPKESQLTFGSGDDLYPSWSPDGTMLLFVRAEPHWYSQNVTTSLNIIRANGTVTIERGNNITISYLDSYGIYRLYGTPIIAWSSDSEKVAYSDGHQIWVYDTKTMRNEAVYNTNSSIADLDWENDSIIFVEGKRTYYPAANLSPCYGFHFYLGSYNISAIKYDGSNYRRLYKVEPQKPFFECQRERESDIMNLKVSPDEKSMVFSYVTWGCIGDPTWIRSSTTTELWTMNTDGSDARKIFDTRGDQYDTYKPYYFWSPDGQIVYDCNPGMNVIDPNKNQTKYVETEGVSWLPRLQAHGNSVFLPDGRIVYARLSVGEASLNAMALDGSAQELLLSKPVDDSWRRQDYLSTEQFRMLFTASVSHDGQIAYAYPIRNDAGFEYWKIWSFEVKPTISTTVTTILPVPYDYQSATNWCGLASLAMILNYYGIQKHSWEIAKELQVPKLGGVIEARGSGADIARLFGTLFNVLLYGTFSVPPSPSDYIMKNYPQLKAKAGYYTSTEQIRKAIEGNISAGYPLMLQLRNDNPPAGEDKGHFVVVVGYNSTGVFINDPSGTLMRWLGKSEALIAAYVSWQDITKFETTNSEMASILSVEGNPNPLDAKTGISTDQVYADHCQLSHAVSIDLDKGLIWRGLFLRHFSVLDPQDTLYLNIPVYNHLNTTRAFDLSLEIIGSDGAVYYSATENTQRVTVKPMFLSYASFILKAPLKLMLEKRYTIHIELNSLDGKRIDCVDLPPIDYVQSGTVIWMSEIQGRLYLHVYDSLGHHTGFDYQTNQIETGIPGSVYAEFSDGQTAIYLPVNVSSFTYVVDAKFASQHIESYNITVNLLWNASVTGKWSKLETIQQGQTNRQTLQVDVVHGTVTINENMQQFWYLLVIVVTLVGGIALIFYRRRRHRANF